MYFMVHLMSYIDVTSKRCIFWKFLNINCCQVSYETIRLDYVWYILILSWFLSRWLTMCERTSCNYAILSILAIFWLKFAFKSRNNIFCRMTSGSSNSRRNNVLSSRVKLQVRWWWGHLMSYCCYALFVFISAYPRWT